MNRAKQDFCLHNRTKRGPGYRMRTLFCLLSVFFMLIAPGRAYAFCCDCCATYPCALAGYMADAAKSTAEHAITQDHITRAFAKHEDWLVWDYIPENFYLAWMRMTRQLAAVGLMQAYVIGAFIDADLQRDTMRVFQIKTAEAYRDYTPSPSVCSFGTGVRALASSEQRGKFSHSVLSKRMLDRQLLTQDSISATGKISDKEARVMQFIRVFCEPMDHNNMLSLMCASGGGPINRKNMDINFTEALYSPWTLDIDFVNTTIPTEDDVPTEDEENIMALANNLYGHNVLPILSVAVIKSERDRVNYLDIREIAAKRAVAYNSFNSLVAQKVRSSNDPTNPGNPYPYMSFLLKEFGFSPSILSGGDVLKGDEIRTIIGENPSYYTQMEFLTKKFYQYPEFYTNLYDKPANVARKGVAMRAIDLMQGMDSFDSQLRFESMLSILLELKIMTAQEEVQNRINRAAR